MLADDVTMFRKLRPSVLLRLIQEISIAHTEALGAGRAKTLDKGVLWVVARMKIEISRLPTAFLRRDTASFALRQIGRASCRERV